MSITCRVPKVVCCVWLCPGDLFFRGSHRKGFVCRSVCRCLFLFKKKKKLQESMLCEFKNTEHMGTSTNKQKRHCLASVWFNKWKSSFNVRHPKINQSETSIKFTESQQDVPWKLFFFFNTEGEKSIYCDL